MVPIDKQGIIYAVSFFFRAIAFVALFLPLGASSAWAETEYDPEVNAMYSVLQCPDPTMPWKDASSATPDWLTTPAAIESTFSGFTTQGYGNRNPGNDYESTGSKRGLEQVGQFGKRTDDESIIESQTQELDCWQLGETERHWMGSVRHSERTPMGLSGWHPLAPNLSGNDLNDNNYWTDVLKGFGLPYDNGSVIEDSLLWDSVYMRQNMRMPGGSSLFAVAGRWRACIDENVVPQIWGQSLITNDNDIPFSAFGGGYNGSAYTWAPSGGERDNDSDPNPAGGTQEAKCSVNKSGELRITWKPSDICKKHPVGSYGYMACQRKLLVVDASDRKSEQNPTSRSWDPDSAAGAFVHASCGPNGCVDGLNKNIEHNALTKELSVVRVGSICAGPGGSGCFRKERVDKKVKRCFRWVWNSETKKYDRGDYRWVWYGDNCPRTENANWDQDFKWGDGDKPGNIVHPNHCWNNNDKKWILIGDPDDKDCTYSEASEKVNPNPVPWVEVQGYRYELPAQNQRAMFSRGVLSAVDRADPRVGVPPGDAYIGMTSRDFPNNQNYQVVDGAKPEIRFSASDSGGGLHRAVLNRSNLSSEAGVSVDFPTRTGTREGMRFISPPLISHKYPTLTLKPSIEGTYLAASPGSWHGAQAFRYIWKKRINGVWQTLPPSQDNFIVLKGGDTGAEIQVGVQASWLQNPSEDQWSSVQWSAVTAPAVDVMFVAEITSIFGTPRVGQTIAVVPDFTIFTGDSFTKFSTLYRCSKRVQVIQKDFFENICTKTGATFQKPGTYKIQPADVGKWLILGTADGAELALQQGSWTAEANPDQDLELYAGYFPGFVSASLVNIYFGNNAAAADSPVRIDGEKHQPPAVDIGILPPYTQSQELCLNEPGTEIISKEQIAPSAHVAREFTTSTSPCPTSIPTNSWEVSWRENPYNPGYLAEDNFWSEGLNKTWMQVYDFCTRDAYGNCYSNPSNIAGFDDIVIDETEPVFSTDAADGGLLDVGSEEDKDAKLAQKCADAAWLASQNWTGWPASAFSPDPRCTQGVQCKVPDGENGWHKTPPECRFQVIDKFKSCGRIDNREIYFAYDRKGCWDTRREAQASLLENVTWWEKGTGNPGNAASLALRDGGEVPLQGLSDGRPSVEVWARDRALNGQLQSDSPAVGMHQYEDFVKIDTRPPIAPLIINGPSETEPEGQEALCSVGSSWIALGQTRDGITCSLQNPSNPASYPDRWIPRAPDESNDIYKSTGDLEENCGSLCWEIEGLEEDQGSPSNGFDYDHEAKLQCQLVYGGTGRTPETEPADWVDPPWALNMSALGSAGGAASSGEAVPGFSGQAVVVASTDWDCASEKGTHGGETTVSPFDMTLRNTATGIQEQRPDGHYLFRVRQKDKAGWTSPWSGRPFVFDTTPPEPGGIIATDSGTRNPESSATRQWLFRWGWDLLARDGFAGTYCFVSESDTSQIVRRSGWGCGPTTFPDNRYDVNGPQNTPSHNSLGYASLRRDLPEDLETPMPFLGVNGEGRGTLAGLPDGAYKLGIWQRDKLGQKSEWRNLCEDATVIAASDESDSACVGFVKNGGTIGPVPEPKVELEALLPKESVTSRRTEAELLVRTTEPLLSGQAFFPMSGSILHSTPQDLYSFCQTMDQNYAEYMPGNLSWSMDQREVAGLPPEALCPGGESVSPYDYATAIRHAGSLSLGEPDPASALAEGNFTLNIFWLRPTLASEDRPARESAYGGGE